MSEIENLGVSVEEYLDGLAEGIDVLELKRLEAKEGNSNKSSSGSYGDCIKGNQWHSYP
ncbi:hypothetical protein [Nostoc flagelliforme]|uniref:hypothetical protein n=1 Tax=Nostoc flagelliforme TaxID=1306274 RepID=UPI001F5495A0|nr:hypothetical protein [Nostoc flagelliforme]